MPFHEHTSPHVRSAAPCIRCALVVVLTLAARLAAAQATGDIRTHDPSTIVRDGGTYWVFHSGPGGQASSSTNMTEWIQGPRIFPHPLGWWTNAAPGTNKDVWAPDVIKVGSRFFLYYSISVLGKRSSVIGLAVSPTLDPRAPGYGWIDQGPVIQTSEKDAFNAIDPCPCFDENGRLWLVFGSYWTGIKAIELDPVSGLRIAPDSPVHALASAPPPSTAIEASYVHRRGKFYYLFVNWGQCCEGTNSTYRVELGRSCAITGPYLDRDGRDLRAGGGTAFLGTRDRFIGPGHIGILSEGDTDWCSFHYYDATDQGRPKLGLSPLAWDAEGWPSLKP